MKRDKSLGRNSRKAILIVLVMITIAGISVGSSPLQGGDATVASSSLQRDLNPDVTTPEMLSIVQSNNAFAFDLYQQLRDSAGNVVYAPYSIFQALLMTLAGARGETERQMAETLHLTLEQPRAHAALNAVDLALEPETTNDDDFQLVNANALWGDRRTQFEMAFLNTLARNYAAVMQLIDFENAPKAARAEINAWISEQTQGRITNLIPAGQLRRDTKLVLANAIYLRARWLHPFDERATRDEPFELRDGGDVIVPMMHQTYSFRYMADRDYQAIELPYANSDVAMLIILPDEGEFDGVEGQLSADFVGAIVDELHSDRVELAIPRFEFEAAYDFVDDLKELGMPAAFENSADFSGTAGDTHLKIAMVRQKAFISVDEEATEVAAGSAVGAILTRLPPRFVADHPFIFVIRDRSTGTILFIGRVDDPTR